MVFPLDLPLSPTDGDFQNMFYSPGPGEGLILGPRYLSPEASESLVVNMTFDAYIVRIFLRCSTFLYL